MPRVTVGPLPRWMPIPTLLGDGAWQIAIEDAGAHAVAELTMSDAADVDARLRGLGFGGLPTEVKVEPSLPRAAVRAARLREARARRDTSPGFTRPGVRLDDEGRRSLTPEPLAWALGERAAGRAVLDLCCGAGGDAIGFARAGSAVVACELDPDRLADARHNARIYGVDRQITFVCGDAREVVGRHDAAVCFVDPPWGGYDKRRSRLADLPLLADLLPALTRFPAVWLKLPPSFEATDLGEGWAFEPMFGVAPGDRRRVKLLLATRGG